MTLQIQFWPYYIYVYICGSFSYFMPWIWVEWIWDEVVGIKYIYRLLLAIYQWPKFMLLFLLTVYIVFLIFILISLSLNFNHKIFWPFRDAWGRNPNSSLMLLIRIGNGKLNHPDMLATTKYLTTAAVFENSISFDE